MDVLPLKRLQHNGLQPLSYRHCSALFNQSFVMICPSQSQFPLSGRWPSVTPALTFTGDRGTLQHWSCRFNLAKIKSPPLNHRTKGSGASTLDPERDQERKLMAKYTERSLLISGKKAKLPFLAATSCLKKVPSTDAGAFGADSAYSEMIPSMVR